MFLRILYFTVLVFLLNSPAFSVGMRNLSSEKCRLAVLSLSQSIQMESNFVSPYSSESKGEILSYGGMRAFVRSLGIRTEEEFRKWAHSSERPNIIPPNPEETYKEWKGWDSFFGTGNAYQ